MSSTWPGEEQWPHHRGRGRPVRRDYHPIFQPRRHTLIERGLAKVTDVALPPDMPAPFGPSPCFEIVLPYAGIFHYAAGRRAEVIDSNQTLFVTAGEDFADAHVVPNVGHACLILLPTPAVMEELCGTERPSRHAAFVRMSVPAGPRLRLLTHRLLNAGDASQDGLFADELLAATFREALSMRRLPRRSGSTRAIRKAKEILHARGCERMALDEIAAEVGMSPIYLTQEFTRAEGRPLYRYQMMLRLGRALNELPHTENLSQLALDLGFSSHSHFTARFKATFGVTPAQAREMKLGTLEVRQA